MTEFLIQASIFLLAAVIAVPLAVRLGLGSVLGYLLAGIVIGPVLGLIGSDVNELQHFAEFGVVMMLFLIGLELEPRALWDMRDRLLGLGGLQIGLTMAAIMGGCILLGFAWPVALAIGMIMALSSTAIVLQTLNEKRLMQTPGGRNAFSVLLTQDIAVIPMLAFMPLLALSALPHATVEGGPAAGLIGMTAAPDGSMHVAEEAAAQGGHGAGHGDHSASAVVHFLEQLPGWGVTLVTISAILAIVLGGHYLTRPVFKFIHGARLREMNTAVALLFVVGVASIMLILGLSPALGTFLAGVVLANSEYRHELEADIEPFKGLLLGLFFLTVGAGINFQVLFGQPLLLLGLTLGLMAVKGIILLFLALLFKIRGRDRWLFTLSLAQAGEFGFVLISFAVNTNVLPGEISQTLLLVVALSMLLTPLLFIVYDQVSARMQDSGGPERPDDEIDEQQPIIIAGIGRFGQVVNRMVQMTGMKTTVLDHDLEMIELMRRFGFKGFFGDPTRPELLHAAGLDKARVLVVTLDDREAVLKLVTYARRMRPDLHIVARARDRVHVYELYAAGANDIVRETFDSSLRAGRYVLENMGMSEFDAADAEHTFFRMDRKAMRDLAVLWKPGVPVTENEAYVARAKELNRDLETALVSTLDETEGMTGHSERFATLESETAVTRAKR
ncbi:cation:proton antiporter [Dinoroseobacter sp. S375]|uniref:cation:proton antiporter domain-containing protein n=1 Tax=Dinoroseobacter sp. S375 TaxID=3415136 RepID=UPI003C7C1DE3